MLVAPGKAAEPILARTPSKRGGARGGSVSMTQTAGSTAPWGAVRPSSFLFDSDCSAKGLLAERATVTVGGHACD